MSETYQKFQEMKPGDKAQISVDGKILNVLCIGLTGLGDQGRITFKVTKREKGTPRPQGNRLTFPLSDSEEFKGVSILEYFPKEAKRKRLPDINHK